MDDLSFRIHQIYYVAVVTNILAVVIFGSLIRGLRMPVNERLLGLAALVVLPLQPLVFYFVRVPFDHWLVAHWNLQPATYHWIRSLYAPLTEEPAKLIPLLIPALRRDIRPENFVRYALAIGLGFALGEMWFVAGRVAAAPAFAGLPFYQFGGYLTERLMTCVFHSAFVSVSLWQLRRRFAFGLLGAMALHWIGNYPLIFAFEHSGHIGKLLQVALTQYWLFFYMIAAAALLAYFANGRFSPGLILFSRRHCPACNRDFNPSILGLNFGPKRYERCPHCRSWQWTSPGSGSPMNPGLRDL